MIQIADQKLKKILKKNRYYFTEDRLEIFRELKEEKNPLHINDLVDRLYDSVDRSTIYRNIDIFCDLGIINELKIGKNHLVELSDMFREHHHHMTCTNCGAIVSFEESDSFIKELEYLEIKHGFRSTSHSLELTGLCKSCS